MTPISNLLAVLKRDKPQHIPIWLMRQAGRYLPEYRALRAEKGGFLDLVYDPEAASAVTLQPIARFGFDAAILFSDILVIPHALGQNLWFEDGEGPRLAPRLLDSALGALLSAPERLQPVFDTVARVRASLPSETAFIGFAGAPWTVATYMLSGRGSKDQTEARRFAYAKPEAFSEIIAAISTLTISYLKGQINAGVDVVQVFESWAGNLSPAQFKRWVIAPNAAIVDAIRNFAPQVPVIAFPKGSGGKLRNFVDGVNPSAIGLDETVDPVWANAVLPAHLPVQGNLDPLALISGGGALDTAVDDIIAAFAGRPHVFNLGHGILPDTPIDHVEQLVARVRAHRC